MNETFKGVIRFLEQNNMQQSVRQLKEEMFMMRSELNPDQTQQPLLVAAIARALNEKQKLDKRKKAEDKNHDRQAHKRQPRVYSQEETQDIMEKLMNKLVQTPNLLEDEKLNAKIEKFFDNQTFQRMVEQADVFHDISNLSIQNSIMRNRPEFQNLNRNSEPSNEHEQAPRFGNQEVSEVLQHPQQQHQQPQKEVKQPKPTHNLPIQNMKKSPSMDELFTEDDIGSAAKKGPKQQAQNPQFEGLDTAKLPSMIRPESGGNDSSLFLQNSQSFVLHELEENKNLIDEYQDDEDPGFDLYEVGEKDFVRVSKQLADKFGFPLRAVVQSKQSQKEEVVPNPFEDEQDSAVLLRDLQSKKKDINEGSSQLTDDGKKKDEKRPKGYIYLPPTLQHPRSNDDFYPVEFDNVIYDCFHLRVIFDRERTGFEETKEFPIVINSIIAGRYQILEYLGSAAFSKAVQCVDLQSQQLVCMKIIENNKDYMDQSIDEIKLLRYINCNGDPDEKNVLKLYDHFYHKEHLFLVTELLKDNLYEFYKYNRENEQVPYFSIGRLQKITRQILVGLEYIHGLKLIHCDLKPENILMKSYSRCECKIIDFGSSCFIHDHLSSYVQSRSYRAPEVIIGCKYDYKIDMWSLGCILCELWTGYVLFQNDTVQGLLARVIGIIGPFPEHMMKEGRLVHNFFTKEKLLYQDVPNFVQTQAVEEGEASQQQPANDTSELTMKRRNKSGKIQILVPKRSNLKARLKSEDMFFLDFVRWLLQVDPAKRPTAKEAMNHPWLAQAKYPENQ